MRRLVLIVVLGLSLAAIVGTGVMARSYSPLSVKASKASPGGELVVTIKLKSVKGVKAAPPTGSATVHFASGDVSAALTRKGKSLEARAKVRVSASEAPGEVAIDVTLLYNGVPFALTTTGVVLSADDDDDDGGGDGGGHDRDRGH
ncbi:MAG: hypothetical protein QOH61_156 [Chloroflexota bacterium]|jgi:hypothetical protein|nr:hypothetical protein [Chloroflexota bacterium]